MGDTEKDMSSTVSYDYVTDTLYIYLRPGGRFLRSTTIDTPPDAPDVIIDWDDDGRPIGVEVTGFNISRISDERISELIDRYGHISREEYMTDAEEPKIIRELLNEVIRLRKASGQKP